MFHHHHIHNNNNNNNGTHHYNNQHHHRKLLQQCMASKQRAQRFDQLFALIGAGFQEYIAHSELLLLQHQQPQQQSEPAQLFNVVQQRRVNNNCNDFSGDNNDSHEHVHQQRCRSASSSVSLTLDVNVDEQQQTNIAKAGNASGNDFCKSDVREQSSQQHSELHQLQLQQQQQYQRDLLLLMENHRLYRVHAQRLAKLQRDYMQWQIRLEKESNRLFNPSNVNNFSTASSSSSTFPINRPFAIKSSASASCISRFRLVPSPSALLLCRRCTSSSPPPPVNCQQQQNLSTNSPTRRLCQQQQRAQSSNNLLHQQQQQQIESSSNGTFPADIGNNTCQPRKSQSVFDLRRSGNQPEQQNHSDNDEEVIDAAEHLTNSNNPKQALRTVRAAMSALEAEMCGMLGRLQFHVQAIVGFARLCAGDQFEVVIKHGHQRWRTRGKTQADKTQRWDQQPPSVTLNVLWNVPIQVKVLEVGFLRSRCLNERQFDPAKFAIAQPQLVTMNLNTVGSIKLQLVVQWLPLLSSSSSITPSVANDKLLPQSMAQASPLQQQQQQIPSFAQANGTDQADQNATDYRSGPQASAACNSNGAITDRNNNSNNLNASHIPNSSRITQHQSEHIHSTSGQGQPIKSAATSNSIKNPWQSSPPTGGALPPKMPTAAAAMARLKQQHSLNAADNAAQNAENDTQQPKQTQQDVASSSPSASVKVCLRDKKRQREQRRQIGLSMAAAISSSASSGIGGVAREASRADKQRWRSSTTLLDEVYKDLARSIPTIDDLSALHSTTRATSNSNGTGGGGSLGHSRRNLFDSNGGTKAMAAGPSSMSSSTASEGRAAGKEKVPTAKRIFSFVKRAERSVESNNRSSQSGEEKAKPQQNEQKADWRKSISLGQIALAKDQQQQQKGNNNNGTGGGSGDDEAEEPDEFMEEIGVDVAGKMSKMPQNKQQIPNGNSGGNIIDGSGGSGRRAKLSSLKKSRQQQQQNGKDGTNGGIPQSHQNGISAMPHRNNGIIPKHSSSVYSLSSSSRASSMDSGPMNGTNANAIAKNNKCAAFEQAIRTLDTLLARIERIRLLLTKLRPAEFTELVAFEAAMLNWEAYLKLNRSGLLCQLDQLWGDGGSNNNNGQQPQHIRAGSGGRRSAGGGGAGQQMLRQRLANNRSSLYLNQPAPNGGSGVGLNLMLLQQQQHSPSTASDETDESGGGANGAGIGGVPTAMHHNNIMLDHISENDSGIDSLRQYHHRHSPSYNSSSSGGGRAGSVGGAVLPSDHRRKSIGAMLDVMLTKQQQQPQQQNNGNGQTQQQQIVTGTGSAEMDQCLDMHLARAEQALQAISDVQDSPFEYTLAKMLCRMESVETIALESMLGMVQDMLDQCKPNPQTVLAQLGLQFPLQQCWLSTANEQQYQPQQRHNNNNNGGIGIDTNGSIFSSAFLLAPLPMVRAELRPQCKPIVHVRYPKLVEKVLDSLMALLCDGCPAAQVHSAGTDKTSKESAVVVNGTNAMNVQSTTKTTTATVMISVFQFVALFRAKQFPAFIENLSHEAWISTSLQTGQPAAVRDVMERLRNVPVVPPLESLRHIGLVLSTQPPHVSAPIEKYFRKASLELALDLAACFLCLLEHDDELSRCGACRALAILRQANTRHCLEFLSRSDTSARVRAEAQSATQQVHRHLRACQQQQQQQQREMTKI